MKGSARRPGRRPLLLVLAAFLAPPARAAQPAIAIAAWRISGEPLQLQAGRGFAGAVSSIRFRGREFIDAADHGRELQGAVQFGSGECLNPTLAGASRDPPGLSSSELLSVSVSPGHYRAATRMAFWARPGATCSLSPGAQGVALNRSAVSDLVYSQEMTPGFEGHANAVLVRIDIHTPQAYPPASVEVLTGYMPPAFDSFSRYDAQSGWFRPDSALAEASGERDTPLVLSTSDGRAAMGVVGLPASVEPRYAGYHAPDVGKWSLVYHEATPFGAGEHRYACIWVIGTRREVEVTLAEIIDRTRARANLQEALLGCAAGLTLALGGALLVLHERRRRRQPLVPL